MDTETIGAIVFNVAACASLAGAVVQWHRQRIPNPRDAAAAFHLLVDALARSFPDLPFGFTLREGLTRARLAGLRLRWEDIDRTVVEYETFRYGGGPIPALPQPEVMSLVKVLRRRL